MNPFILPVGCFVLGYLVRWLWEVVVVTDRETYNLIRHRANAIYHDRQKAAERFQKLLDSWVRESRPY